MRIVKEDIGKFKYAFEFAFNVEVVMFCRSLKNSFGPVNFNFYNGKWRFSNISIMDSIVQQFPFDVEVHSSLQPDIEQYELDKQKETLRLKKAEQLKKSVDTNFTVKGIKGNLYPYQKIGIEFFINNNGKAILADTMGLGKTVQALGYVAHSKKEKTLVICPASVKYSWESEVSKWTKLKPFVVDSQTSLKDLADESFHKHDVFIMNYDIVKKFFIRLDTLRWDCIICDEFHYIKNHKAQRTQLVKKLAKKIPSILLLSGTPLLSRPVELFNGLQLMDSMKWNDYYNYTRKYCGAYLGRFGWDVSGASNIGELQKEISRYFLRRNKDEVLSELPPKRYIHLPVNLDKDTKKKYRLAEDSFIEYLRNIKKKTETEMRKSLQAEALVKLNELRKLTSTGKLENAKEMIEDTINNGEKIVVFSVYNEPLEILYDYFKKVAVLLTGKTEDKERKGIIDKFQNDKNTRVFFGGMKAAGAGITLTSASNVLFIDYSWVPADHWQAQDRIHRIGQKADSVSIYQLFAKDTIDEKMKAILEDKQELFEQLIDGKQITEKKTNLVSEIINKLTT